MGELPAEDAVASPVDGLLAAFRCYLLQERGAAAKTVELYEPFARLFLYATRPGTPRRRAIRRHRGIERGLALAGHHVVAFCEVDPAAIEVLRARFEPDVPLSKDVADLDALPRDAAILAVGFPCKT